MSKYYCVTVDGEPLKSFEGSIQCYTRGEAVKKSKMFNGKWFPVSYEVNRKINLKKSLIHLKDAFCDVLENCSCNEQFGDKYPFPKEFVSMVKDISDWVYDEERRIDDEIQKELQKLFS